MKDEELARVKAETEDWTFMKTLPGEVYGFRLRRIEAARGDMYELFSYENGEACRSVTVYYHSETKEYKLRMNIGSFEFCRMEFITPDLVTMEDQLAARLDDLLEDMSAFREEDADHLLAEKGILKWEYQAFLPDEMEGFSLFIRPTAPVPITNGSHVVVDYEDFAIRSNFAIYYNVFRDIFFSDERVAGVPGMTYEFDAKSLRELEEKLTEKLAGKLREIRARAEEALSE